MITTRSQMLARFAFDDLPEAGDRLALRVRIGPTSQHRDVTFAELRAMALGAAVVLEHQGCQLGQRVAILLPPSHRLVALFFGAIYRGFVPSILAWPTARMDAEKYRRNVLAIVQSLRADFLVTEHQMAEQLGAALGDTRVVEPGSLEGLLAGSEQPPELAPRVGQVEALFIQFSGGTTGTQKSVPIEIEHLERQLASYGEVLRLRDDDAVISWLPLYHDMGLIACQVMPFVHRLPVTAFAPMDWVMDPGRFLASVGRDRSTLLWLPNFGYSFMAKKSRIAPDELDLSSLRAVINCSEPVRAESMEDFAVRFAPAGLRRSALHTCYAMAEATFAVTQSTDVEPPRWVRVSREAYGQGRLVVDPQGDRTLVSCGRPLPDIDVGVVDANGRPCAEGQIGEIWLSGAFVMRDYLPSPDSAPRWAFTDDGRYRTGDFGAFLDGHLFVTGRKKDVIIIGGVNVYPEDVEARVSEVARVHSGRAVALGLEDAALGPERLVVVAEVNETGQASLVRYVAKRRAVLKLIGRLMSVRQGPGVNASPDATFHFAVQRGF